MTLTMQIQQYHVQKEVRQFTLGTPIHSITNFTTTTTLHIPNCYYSTANNCLIAIIRLQSRTSHKAIILMN